MISGISKEAREAKWGFKIQTHKNWFACLSGIYFDIEERTIWNIT